jgi:hypothetical protein
MGGMRKLRRRGHGTQYEVEPLRPQKSFHARKMSEVILDFAEPLLDALDDDELFGKAIGCAVFCWNLSFLQEMKQQRQVRAMANELDKSVLLTRHEFEDYVRMLLERKRVFFANEKRIVVNYKIVEEENHHRLSVTSTFAKD